MIQKEGDMADLQISKFQLVKPKSGEAIYLGCYHLVSCLVGCLIVRHNNSSDVTLAFDDDDL